MRDFENSIRAGLASAKAAQAARTEIKEIFREFNDQLLSASDGAAKIAIVEMTEYVGKKNALLDLVNAFGERRSYDAIVIKHPTSKEFAQREVARWRQSEDGYPCWITIDNRETACSDKDSLEAELANLASSTRVGEAVLAAMGFSPKPAPATAPPPPSPTPDVDP
jgi:hypothetical protein